MNIIRKGDCNHCGWCCQFMSILRVTVPKRDLNQDTERFYALRNGVKGEDGNLRFVSHQFLPCMSHDNVNKKCTIYDERPEICKSFPSVPDQIEGTPCSYWFEQVDDLGNVVDYRGGLGSPYPTPPRFRDIPSSFASAGDNKAKPIDLKELKVGEFLKEG